MNYESSTADLVIIYDELLAPLATNSELDVFREFSDRFGSIDLQQGFLPGVESVIPIVAIPSEKWSVFKTWGEAYSFETRLGGVSSIVFHEVRISDGSSVWLMLPTVFAEHDKVASSLSEVIARFVANSSVIDPAGFLTLTDPTTLDNGALDYLRKLVFTRSISYQQRSTTLNWIFGEVSTALSKNAEQYLESIFIPLLRLLGETAENFAQIRKMLSDESKGAYTTEDARHVSEVYRRVVSELLDPYLTFVTATIHFNDGNLPDLGELDLDQLERNKIEWITSKIRKSGDQSASDIIFAGYDPTVRNALSHAGAQSVVYGEKSVVYRSIQRGTPPKITKVVEWSFEVLYRRTVELMEFLACVDIAIEIVRFDCTAVLDFERMLSLVDASGSDARAALSAKFGEPMSELRHDSTLTVEERITLLRGTLEFNFQLRKMDFVDVIFGKDESCLIQIPAEAVPKIRTQADLPVAVSKALRYLIVAYGAFQSIARSYIVVVISALEGADLSIFLQDASLADYVAEEAGLVDLVDEAICTIEETVFRLPIDFQALREQELRHLGGAPPKRRRRE